MYSKSPRGTYAAPLGAFDARLSYDLDKIITQLDHARDTARYWALRDAKRRLELRAAGKRVR